MTDLAAVDHDEAIRKANSFGHDKVVELPLNDSRVNPDSMSNYAIWWASNRGHDNLADHYTIQEMLPS